MGDRSIDLVIEKMKAVVPVDQAEFHQKLDWTLNDSFFRPPEDQGISWGYLTEFSNKFATPPTEDWQFEVLAVLVNVSVDEIKKTAEKQAAATAVKTGE